MTRAAYTRVETIQVPPRVVDLAERRTRPLIRAAIPFDNALKVIAASCYLQGFQDAFDARADAPPQEAKP